MPSYLCPGTRVKGFNSPNLLSLLSLLSLLFSEIKGNDEVR